MATVRPGVAREIFPALGAFIGGGFVAGIIVSVVNVMELS